MGRKKIEKKKRNSRQNESEVKLEAIHCIS